MEQGIEIFGFFAFATLRNVTYRVDSSFANLIHKHYEAFVKFSELDYLGQVWYQFPNIEGMRGSMNPELG